MAAVHGSPLYGWYNFTFSSLDIPFTQTAFQENSFANTYPAAFAALLQHVKHEHATTIPSAFFATVTGHAVLPRQQAFDSTIWKAQNSWDYPGICESRIQVGEVQCALRHGISTRTGIGLPVYIGLTFLAFTSYALTLPPRV